LIYRSADLAALDKQLDRSIGDLMRELRLIMRTSVVIARPQVPDDESAGKVELAAGELALAMTR
jgi:hypothetical protein